MSRRKSLLTRVMTLPLVFVGALVLLEFADRSVDQRVRENVIFPEFENQMMTGHRTALQALVDGEALSLGQAVVGVDDPARRKAIIERETDPQRYFADKSGYFFSYLLDGTRISVPPNKAGNGKNFIGLKDAKGVPFIQQLVDQARAGGGFVEYDFEKPGQGIQPKLSYAKQIPGTDAFVGTGVYVDNVMRERAALKAKLDEKTKEYGWYKLALVVVAFSLVLTLSLLIMREREQLVARQNRDMKLVLDNVSQGFVVIDPRGQVAGERSAIAERWFGVPAPEQPLAEWLAPGDARFVAAFGLAWDQLVEGLMPREVCVEQLPHRLTRTGITWSLSYQLLTDARGAITQVMVVLTDITAVLEREAAERTQRETVEVFQRLGRDRSGFLDFVADGRRLLDRLEKDPSLDVTEQLRAVHTLKGNSAVQGIQSVASCCHEVETRMVDEGGKVRPEDVVAIGEAWVKLEAQVQRFSGADRDVVELEGALVRDLEARIARREPHAQLERAIESWSLEPVRRRLVRLGDQATGLALRLGKGPLEVRIESDATRLAPESHTGFWSALVHVVRNAVDHGFERPGERGAKGKPRLTLTSARVDEALEVRIEDDGRGIAWDVLARKAAEKGLPHQERSELLEALFTDGISTADAVRETSGRGVGMSAVRAEVLRAGGTITVTSEPGQGTCLVFRLPLAAAVRQAA